MNHLFKRLKFILIRYIWLFLTIKIIQLKKLFALLSIVFLMNSCIYDEIFNPDEPSDVPGVISFTRYISQNSVRLNGFIDNSNNYYQGSDTYKVGFKFRAGDENDSSNDEVIELEENVEYQAGTRIFSTDITSLEPNTTYYYTCYTKNGDKRKDNWKSFTTSDLPCEYGQNNYYSISGDAWKNANVHITHPNCCYEGNIGFEFGTWPDIYEISFNELSNVYPITGQYFGVDYEFAGTSPESQIVRSTNQVLIGDKSTPETELFVENDGETITLIFCNTILRNGDVLNGKVSVAIPQN